MDIFLQIPLLLTNSFERLGRFVATHPRKIIIISLISSTLMSVAIIKIQIEKRMIYLTSPINCRAYNEERTINHLFPMNMSNNFDFYRMASVGLHINLMVVSKTGGTVLKNSILKEAIEMDRMIRSFEIEWMGNIYNYSNVCAKNNGECYYNELQKYVSRVGETEEFSIKYPIEIDIYNMQFNVTALAFGGVTIGSLKQIVDAKALRLLYFLDNSADEVAEKWKQECLASVSKQKSNDVIFMTLKAKTLDEEFWKLAIYSFKCGLIVVILLGLTCVLICMTSNWVTSKPLLGVAGCVSAGQAIIASFAMITAIGVPFSAFNSAVPFLIIGVGVDDMFILIAAWRKTDSKDNVINRMGDAYSHAAMSVTMTSLTNLISFIVGATLPIPIIRNFCIQCVFAIAFDLIYQLTFFGSCMALDGYREENKLHPVTFKPIILAKDAADRNWIYRKLFTNKLENSSPDPPKVMIWFRDTLGNWINQTWSKTLILIIYAMYLAGATWGITTLKQGLSFRDLVSYNSDAYVKFEHFSRYFGNYSYTVQVVINHNLDYSNRTVQKDTTRVLNSIKGNKYISSVGFNWLKHYLFFIRYHNNYVSSYNLSNPREFNTCLRDVFFQHPMGKAYKNDVVFDSDGIHISASRYVILPKGDSQLSDNLEVPRELRLIADSLPYSVTVQSASWLYYEVQLITEQITVKSIMAAITATTFVFLIFSQHFLNVVCVIVTIISIEFGVLGFMAAFGVNLNIGSAMMLTICIGLCIDPSAHVMYAYTAAKGTLRERIQQTLFTAGMPVVQGSITTLLAVIPLAIIPNYTFRMIIIVTYIQITIALSHAIFILPTALSFCNTAMESIRNFKESKANSANAATSSPISVINTSHL